MWKEQKSFTGLALGESDYTKMAYELTVRMPEKYEEIRATQATRIQDPDVYKRQAGDWRAAWREIWWT